MVAFAYFRFVARYLTGNPAIFCTFDCYSGHFSLEFKMQNHNNECCASHFYP